MIIVIIKSPALWCWHLANFSKVALFFTYYVLWILGEVEKFI